MARTMNHASLAVDAVLDYNPTARLVCPQYRYSTASASSSRSNGYSPSARSVGGSGPGLSTKSVTNLVSSISNIHNNYQQDSVHSLQQLQRIPQRTASAKDLTESGNGSPKTAQVVLLDGRRLTFQIQPRLFAGDLFDMVAANFNLKEKEYFGLAYINQTGTFNWLNLDKRVVEHEFPDSSTNNNNKKVQVDDETCSLGGGSEKFDEIQTLNRSSTRRIGELKRKNLALKASKKVAASSLTNLNSVQNKLKQKFNSNGMLSRLTGGNNLSSIKNPPLTTNSVTAPSSQVNSRHSSMASIDELIVNDSTNSGIYQEVTNIPFTVDAKRSMSYCALTFDDSEDINNSTQQHDIVLYFMVKYFVESIRMLTDTVTMQLFYLQAKSLLINEYIQVSAEVGLELAALILQITYGDSANFSAEKTQGRIQKWRLISNQLLKDLSEKSEIERRIIELYGRLGNVSRGECIFRFMTLIEKQPAYGVHYFEVLENRTRELVWLGFSNKGIHQFDYSDRRIPERQFSWKQLENLYFRELKFSIEVCDAKRVVLALSSINLYENAIEEIDHLDDLSSAICDPTTQVSVSRRTFGPSNVTVYVWLSDNCQLTKCMWSMAVAQHQFYTDRHSQKGTLPALRPEEDIIRALDGDKCLLVSSRSNWSKRKSLSSKSSSKRAHPQHYSSTCSVSSRNSSISGSLSNLSDCSSSSSLSSELQTFDTDLGARMSGSLKTSERSRNLISRRLKLLEMQLSDKLAEIDKLDRLENHLLRKASSQAKINQSRPRLQDYLEVVNCQQQQAANNRASISSSSSSGTSVPTMPNRPLKSSHSINSSNSLRNFVVTGRSSVAGSVVSHNSADNAPYSKRLPPLPPGANMQHPLPTPPPQQNQARFQHGPSFVSPQVQRDGPYNSNSHSQTPYFKASSNTLPSLTSPYIDRFDKSVQDDGFNLYSVPNRRTSVAMNSFDDFFTKTAPKFQSTTSLDKNGGIVTSVKSTNLTTDSNSVIYETVTYSSGGSNNTSRVGSHTNLTNFQAPLVESSVDDDCDRVPVQSTHARTFFRDQRPTTNYSALDEQNMAHYRSSFIDRSMGRMPEETITYSTKPTELSSNDCRIPIVNHRPQKIEVHHHPSSPAPSQSLPPPPPPPPHMTSKIYTGTTPQAQQQQQMGVINQNKRWTETDLNFPTGNMRQVNVHATPARTDAPTSPATPLILQAQKVLTFLPQSMALTHAHNQNDVPCEVESSVDDIVVTTTQTKENIYDTAAQNIPTPSPSPPNLSPPPPPLPQPTHCVVPPSSSNQVPLVLNQVQNRIPAYITNSEPHIKSNTGSAYSQPALNCGRPVQFHSASMIVERSAPLQSRATVPVTTTTAVPATVSCTSPTPSSVSSSNGSKRNSAAYGMSSNDSMLSSPALPMSPPFTVAFVPSTIAESVSSQANSSNTGSNNSSNTNIPIASCKGNIVEVDVVTVGQFQPGYEEEKPFTMDDFFKYSQKYRNSKPSPTSNTSNDNVGQLSADVGHLKLNGDRQ